jgi:hypothetical protein
MVPSFYTHSYLIHVLACIKKTQVNIIHVLTPPASTSITAANTCINYVLNMVYYGMY